MTVVVAAVLAGTSAPTPAAAQGPPPVAPPTGGLELFAPDRETTFRLVDVPPRQGERRPPSAGDLLIIRGVLRSPAGARLGRYRAVFTVTSKGQRLAADAVGTFVLAGGQITVQGPTTDTPRDVLSITGGSGVYAGARGTLHAEETRAGVAFRLDFVG